MVVVLESVLIGLAMFGVFELGYFRGRKAGKSATRIVPVARKIDGRVVSKYTRAERRAHKRRHRG